MFKAVTVQEAKTIISKNWTPPGFIEEVTLEKALGRRLAQDILSGEDVPGFSRSTVDGFAVKAEDTFGATAAMPAYLEVTGSISMGEQPAIVLDRGETVQIATGGMLPQGADAVVMLEKVEWLDQSSVGVTEPVAPGENVIRRGEDMAQGQVILTGGHKLRPQDMGLLASLGISSVPVYVPLNVGIISTGNELVGPQEPVKPGQVRDINSYTLCGQVQASGGIPVLYGIIPDDFDRLREAVGRSLEQNPITIISGGSSVGTRDLTQQVLESVGPPGVLFHGLSIRPGKPTLAAVAQDRLVLGLPGHPVSSMVVFEILVCPLLEWGNYNRQMFLKTVRATLTRNIASPAGREDYVRVKVRRQGKELIAEPVLGKSGLISTMVRGDGLIVIPLGREGMAAGEQVEVTLF